MKACYKNDLKRAYLILEGTESTKEDYQICMLRENDIPGVLKTDIRYVDDISQYYYDISGKVSLKAAHEKVKLSYVEIKALISDLLRTIKTVHRYMLDADCLLLDPEYIFCEKEKFFFCYFPQGGTELKQEFHRLTEYFVSEVDYKEKESVRLAYSLHRETMEENYSIERILADLEKEEEEETKSTSIVTYEEQMDNQDLETKTIREKKELWEPVKRLLERKKREKWGYWDEIYIEEEDL